MNQDDRELMADEAAAQKRRCGNYCKKLGPEEQRRVIQRLMLEQHKRQ